MIGESDPSWGSKTHYPSWGSKTRRRRDAENRGRDLITPHGDRKPVSPVSSTTCCPISLPLMGIENILVVHRDDSAGLGLITPHGDRKPAGPGGGPVAPATALITPHGDRKHDDERHHKGDDQNLITPHGDRKHQCTAGRTPPGGRFSLPLMGIENRYQAWPRERPSHYPSWGSKTRYRGARPAQPSTTHYPSWGSKTCRWPAVRPSRLLSHYPSWGSKTGHQRQGALALRAPHYPSWGSKTLVGGIGAGLRDRLISLPLMGIVGIENENYTKGRPVRRCPCRLRAPHYPSWGSKTHRSDRLAVTSHLITPHGDRKHEPLRAATEYISLPLMGIENAGRCARTASGSLPLMGIENPYLTIERDRLWDSVGEQRAIAVERPTTIPRCLCA